MNKLTVVLAVTTAGVVIPTATQAAVLSTVSSAEYYSQGTGPAKIDTGDVVIGFWGTPHVSKGVLRFDDLPSGTTGVSEATLHVYMGWSDGAVANLPLSISSNGLTGEWTTSTTYADLNNMIGTAGGGVTITAGAEAAAAGWYTIDVTSIVQGWITPGNRNIVLSGNFANEGWQVAKHFETAVGNVNAPYINVTPIPEPASLALLALSAVALLRRRRG